MSKKSRRGRAKLRTTARPQRSESEKVVRQDSQEMKSSVVAVSDPQIAHSVKAISHRYVLSELRQIGIIAGFLIVILIILTFVLG